MYSREHSRPINIEAGGHKDDQNLLSPPWHHPGNGDVSAQTTITSNNYYTQSTESNGTRFFR